MRKQNSQVDDNAEAVADEAPVESAVAKDETEAPVESGLVPMAKDGKLIGAHPSTVGHHKSNGWKLA
jgi:hypothetical protein